MPEPKPQIFEVSWEVCNKVGGIHTVLLSKLPQVLGDFPDRYCAVGPYLEGSHSAEFRSLPLPKSWEPLASELSKEGIAIHYGQWLVPGEPPAVLVDWRGFASRLNELKARYWEAYRLDTLNSNYYDVDEPLLWSVACGKLIEAYARHHPDQPVLAQAHEWMSGGVMLHLNPLELANPVKTVFTTHATVLGRALSSRAIFIYDKLDKLNPDEESRRYGVQSKHQLESLAARLATVFTTVSHVTAEEATAFLGRKPDVVTENGLDINSFPTFDRLSVGRLQMREQLDRFVSAYFFPRYRFDLDKTTYQFTMGRYEVHNKGYDLYLQTLGRLNYRLKSQNSDRSVIAFFLVPGDVSHVRPDVTVQLVTYAQIMQELDSLVPGVRRRIYSNLWEAGANQTAALPIPTEVQTTLDELMARLPAYEPPLSPFEMRQGEGDDLMRLAKENGLHNAAEDRVKVILFPIYIDGFDGIFNVPLYRLISGFDLGVFPSLYEPWGYTPMESLAAGVPAITSNLAGFGRSVSAIEQPPSSGSFILDRWKSNEEEVRETLAKQLETPLLESEREWLLRRINAYTTIQMYGWDSLYDNYRAAYRMAFSAS